MHSPASRSSAALPYSRPRIKGAVCHDPEVVQRFPRLFDCSGGMPTAPVAVNFRAAPRHGGGLSGWRFVVKEADVEGVKTYVLTVGYVISDLRRVLVHISKYRTKVKTDLIAACELELYISSLM